MLDLTVGSLFAGIGGLDLGAERVGFEVAWQCEKDDYCTRVLNKHWPDTPVYDDVQTLYTDDGPSPERPDILCGGFPCQDISCAGNGAGLSGDRSGLWWEFARTIGVVGPRYVVVENVPALARRGLDAILGWLAENGYDAEWQIVSAAAMGAPHIRERLFLVAYPNDHRRKARGQNHRKHDRHEPSTSSEHARVFSHPGRNGRGAKERDLLQGQRQPDTPGGSPESGRRGQKWPTEPRVGRLADGVSDRVDRLRGLGNAVVPQVAEFVFTCIRGHADPCP